MKIFSTLIFTTIIGLLLFTSCKKEDFITSPDARLTTSVDSIKFDTVFTSRGSITQSFKILNNNDQKILISNIKLSGGALSPFKMNVNGIQGNEIRNTQIASNDSIYVFVTVTVNPTTANLPFILSDSILINFNGVDRFVQLEAYGQNAVFIRNGLVSGNVTFTNTQPYVILGGLQVGTGSTLTIDAGTKIYCHADAPILIDGTLRSNGTFAQPVLFAGDRLDEPYNAFPAGWPGIYFRANSINNSLQFTNVLNAFQAIVVLQPATNANPKLILNQCKIDNAFDAGLLLVNTRVDAQNCLITNSGRNIEINAGGTYNFTHCTVAGYSNNFVLHKKPAIFVNNFNDNNVTSPVSVTLKNSIFWGDSSFVKNEISTQKMGTSTFVVSAENCLYRNNNPEANASFIQSINKVDPSFDTIDVNRRIYDFRITKNASAIGINKGAATPLTRDLDDKNRNVGLPDIGAFEKQ